jgi:hypothetical protein
MKPKIMKPKKEGDYIIRSICFDQVTWDQSHEILDENGIKSLSALVRMALRQYYKQRHAAERLEELVA